MSKPRARPRLKLDEKQLGSGNHLYYGDNLTIMQNMKSASIDLIYLDPPFNSQRNYNLIYKQLTGRPVPEQEEAFCDAWEMDPEKEEMARKMPVVLREYGVDEGIVQFWMAWIKALKTTQPRLLAYLIYMSYRLFEMRRILRPTGSLYLHCDPIASHYIKVILTTFSAITIFEARSSGSGRTPIIQRAAGGQCMTYCCSTQKGTSTPGIEFTSRMTRNTLTSFSSLTMPTVAGATGRGT